MAPITTRAVLLRAYPFGETSHILRFYTDQQGLMGVVARGVRSRTGKGAATLATFASGDLTVYVKPHRDLQTMKDFACTRPRGDLGTDVLRFAGASAVAELVLSHADQEDPRPDLFRELESALDTLAEVEPPLIPSAGLAGLWRMVDAFGFTPQLDPCVRCSRPIADDESGRFDLAAGGLRCAACSQEAAGPRIGPGARSQLARLLSGNLAEPITHARAHLALLSDFVAYHVAPKPLRSVRFLSDLLPPDAGP